MILKNTTILSNEEAIDEIVCASKKYYNKKFIFSGFLIGIGIVMLAIMLGLSKGQDSALLGYLFISFGTVLCALNIFSILSIRRKAQKQNPILFEQGLTNFFTFKEESFQLQVKIGTNINKVEYAYVALKEIVDYDDKIAFVVSPLEIYICKKDAFQNPKEVEQFFYGLSKHKTKVKIKHKSS